MFYIGLCCKLLCSLYLLTFFSLYYWLIVLVLIYFCTSCKISAIVIDQLKATWLDLTWHSVDTIKTLTPISNVTLVFPQFIHELYATVSRSITAAVKLFNVILITTVFPNVSSTRQQLRILTTCPQPWRLLRINDGANAPWKN